MTDFKFTAEVLMGKFSFMGPRSQAEFLNEKIAPLVAELEKLRRLTTEPDHGNEYAIVCHYKGEVDKARAELASLKAKLDGARTELAEAFTFLVQMKQRHYRTTTNSEVDDWLKRINNRLERGDQ